MIHWPTKLTPIARSNLDRFRATSAAAAFEADQERWTVENWAWTAEPPLHVRLRNDALVEIDFVMGDDGLWRMERAPIDTHLAPFHDVLPNGEEKVNEEQLKELSESVPPGFVKPPFEPHG
jgi:hypothetical protein